VITAIPTAESITVEFKSDQKCLPDNELIETVVCLANSEGGEIYLGVEDDGTPTGLHAKHQRVDTLPAFIGNRTTPSIEVSAEKLSVGGHDIAKITVPKSSQITSTTGGVFKRRRLMSDGRPECVPFLPHEISTRLSDLGSLDATAQPVPGATLDDLDDVERGRLRQFVERYQGDSSLLDLSNEELDGALGLTVRTGDGRKPTLLGVLIAGKQSALRRLVPTHEVAFQVLDGEEVRTNEFSRAPLLHIVEWLDTLFKPLNPENEIQAGLFRVPVPRVDARAYREAIANALTHRDYTRLGAVHVRLNGDALTVSNPGGFVEGVTLANILTTEPRPRNPALADTFKRVGLVERTGRGVDLIYRGLLRFGRPHPDYSRSDAQNVVLQLSTTEADAGFLELVLQEEQRLGSALPIDSLIVLAALRDQRRIGRSELATLIQKDDAAIRRTLEALRERGLVESHGRTKGATYTLSPQVYASLGQRAEYTRQAGFDRLQHEEMVKKYVLQHGVVKRGDVMDLCHLSGDQATRLLKRLTKEGFLCPVGERRHRQYKPGANLGTSSK
jgi:ATP-dependent DNA helicase RecG